MCSRTVVRMQMVRKNGEAVSFLWSAGLLGWSLLVSNL